METLVIKNHTRNICKMGRMNSVPFIYETYMVYNQDNINVAKEIIKRVNKKLGWCLKMTVKRVKVIFNTVNGLKTTSQKYISLVVVMTSRNLWQRLIQQVRTITCSSLPYGTR